MPRLTEELIVEILVKLPVKSLLRFRCVCKTWSDLIRSPYFISRHLEHQYSTKDNVCCIIITDRDRQDDDQTSTLSVHSSLESTINNVASPNLLLPHELESFCVKYFWPCNGLVCLSDGTRFVLCNPAMREFRFLPPPPFRGSGPEATRRSCTEATGFGFDPVAEDYKVVTIVRLYLSYAFGYLHLVAIYNLMANSWREINHNIPKACHFSGDGTLLNGVFHWIVWSKGKSKHFQHILCFNMSTEVFQFMELPGHDDRLAKSGRGLHLTVLHGSLVFLVCTGYTQPCRIPERSFDVWVMQNYGVAESWTKQYVIGPVTGIYHPILLWKNEAILIESSEGRQLVSCELNTRERNYFEVHGDLRIWGLVACNESLIAIN